MKILILAHHAEGLYLPRRELIIQLKEAGYTVMVAIPIGKCYDKVADIVDDVIPAPIKRRGMNPLADIKLIQFYYRLLKNQKPDCVLTYAIKPNLYGGMMAKLCNVPYIMNITGLGTAFVKENILCKLVTAMYKIVAGHEQCVFFQNMGNRNVLEKHGIHWRNPVLIPGSGVNLDLHRYEEYPDENDSIRIVFVSRILREKGIYELANAAQNVKNDYPNVEFHVLGKCEAGYEQIMKKWNDEGIFIYHGHQTDVHKYLKNAHALVHPSYYPEGMSNVCLEAAATGRPVLTTHDVYGCKETIDDGITGFGFQSRSVKELEKAIRSFLKLSHVEKRLMGIKGRKKMEKEFDRQLVINSYLAEIKKIG